MARMEIVKLWYNWHQQSDGKHSWQDYDVANIEDSFVKEIKEHLSKYLGDKTYYDIIYENGGRERIYNPCRVFYRQEKELNNE